MFPLVGMEGQYCGAVSLLKEGKDTKTSAAVYLPSSALQGKDNFRKKSLYSAL